MSIWGFNFHHFWTSISWQLYYHNIINNNARVWSSLIFHIIFHTILIEAPYDTVSCPCLYHTLWLPSPSHCFTAIKTNDHLTSRLWEDSSWGRNNIICWAATFCLHVWAFISINFGCCLFCLMVESAANFLVLLQLNFVNYHSRVSHFLWACEYNDSMSLWNVCELMPQEGVIGIELELQFMCCLLWLPLAWLHL
jgi:hypothetical protein